MTAVSNYNNPQLHLQESHPIIQLIKSYILHEIAREWKLITVNIYTQYSA